MPLQLKETPLGGDLRPFLDLVDYVYRGDSQFVRPLDMDLKDRLSKKNPFFEHADGTTFTAHNNGKCVGRITAQIDHAHLARYQDDAGFFGFLDTVDDAEVVKMLIDRAAEWLKERGMRRVRGPMSLNINEEIGCLIDGFDTPPMILMPHHRPYQGGLIEQAGLAKLKDFYAWRYEVGQVPKRAMKAHEEISQLNEVTTRVSSTPSAWSKTFIKSWTSSTTLGATTGAPFRSANPSFAKWPRT